MSTEHAPDTLLQAVNYFADPGVALAFVANLRWPEGVACPVCGAANPLFMQTRKIWKCRGCKKQFSAKVGTIFEDSPIPLTKWLPAMWMLANCKNGISSYELGRALGVTQKTAWFMLHRIRLAMQTKTFQKIGGTVEVDETFIGGRARYMHRDRRERMMGCGRKGKVAVMGLLERHNRMNQHSTVRTKIIPGTKKHNLQPEIRTHVVPGSSVFSDKFPSYEGLDGDYTHKVIDHAECYAKGNVHTNGLENFWSLLKRAIKGTYVSIEPFHLFRYLDEECFRFNNRETNDGHRFLDLVSRIFGRRLTYTGLTGKELPETC